MTPPQEPARSTFAPLWLFALANYAAALALLSGYPDLAHLSAPGPALFVAAGVLSYPALYVAAALAPAALLLAVGSRRGEPGRGARALADALAVAGASLLLLLLYTDRRTHEIFGFHLNGFVWNLLTTRGGIASLGAGAGTLTSAAALAALVVAAESLLLFALRRSARVTQRLRPLCGPRLAAGFAACLALFFLGNGLAYGWSDLQGDRAVLRQAEIFPVFVPMRFKGVAASLGYLPERAPNFEVAPDDSALLYPLEPLRGAPPARPLNVLWLCAESLRADMLDPEIMPATYELAQRSTRFLGHVAGGSGTRMSVFSMFYGLPGSYWFSFLSERRGPVLIDRLLEQRYQVEAITSDDFSYPEFARTVWSRVDSAHLHELGEGGGATWERDRRNVDLIVRLLAQRDPARPFFLFSFLESPHARYDFPPESVIREPYLADFDYVSSDLARDMPLIKNRYVNSVHHLDSQLARIFAFLREQDLFDSTVVIVTGDHGEEFMEHGRWGHNSGVSEEQIRVPLVIWVPGHAPAVALRLTSHLDLPATLLTLLGVANAPESYSLGMDLFGAGERRSAYLADWGTVTFLDPELKLRFPVSAGRVGEQATTRDDAEIADPSAALASRRADLVHMLGDLARFRKAPRSGARSEPQASEVSEKRPGSPHA